MSRGAYLEPSLTSMIEHFCNAQHCSKYNSGIQLSIQLTRTLWSLKKATKMKYGLIKALWAHIESIESLWVHTESIERTIFFFLTG